MPLHIIMDHTPDIEEHAVKLVKQRLAALDTGAPLIPAAEDAHEPFECDECSKPSWRKINSYRRTCDACKATEDARYAEREMLEIALDEERLAALRDGRVTVAS